MPNTMTREEAVCACDNILDLVECMDERLPDQYANSVADRTRDMRAFIKDKWRSDHITEKMDNYLRNTWGGLRRWDREDEHNDDLFYGLGEAREEIEDADEAGDTAAGRGGPVGGSKKAAAEGQQAHARLKVETEAALAGLTPEQRARLEAMTPKQDAAREKAKETFKEPESKPGPSSEETKNPRPSPGTTTEMMQKAHTVETA